MYTARQLSFTDVTFDIKDVSLGDKFIEMYDSSVEMVSIHVHVHGYNHTCTVDHRKEEEIANTTRHHCT